MSRCSLLMLGALVLFGTAVACAAPPEPAPPTAIVWLPAHPSPSTPVLPFACVLSAPEVPTDGATR